MNDQSQNNKNVTRGAFTVALGTGASRVLGLIRDMIIVALFSRFDTDAFFVAFTIPNVLRRLVGEGALTIAFIPVFTDEWYSGSEKRGKEFIANISGVLFVALVILTAIGIVFAPWIVTAYSYGFSDTPGKLELTIKLTQIMFPYLLFMGLSALFMGVLNTMNHFFAPAFAPVMLNLSFIVCAFLLPPVMIFFGLPPIASLGFGVLLGGLLNLAVHFPPMKKLNLIVKPSFDYKSPPVKRTMKLLAPAIIGIAIYQIDILISRLFASFLPEGSVTYLYNSIRLTELPQGLFIMAMATATLPSLSRAKVEGDYDKLNKTYLYSITTALFIAIPAAIGLMALAQPIINVLFQRGEFTSIDTVATASSLKYLSISLIFVALIRQTVPLYYALEDSKTPVKGSFINLAFYISSSIILMKYLLHSGIALGITIATAVQVIYIFWKLKKKLPQIQLKPIFNSIVKFLILGVPMGLISWGLSFFGNWNENNLIINLPVLFISLFIGMGFYLGFSYLLKFPELHEILKVFKRKI